MSITIRPFQMIDILALHAVFYTAIHRSCNKDYSPAQLNVWAPKTANEAKWSERICSLNPYVALFEGSIAGYADVQVDGYIDHFYVHADFQKRGVGTALMQAVIEKAKTQNVTTLYSHVSLTAQGFFKRYGFFVEKNQQVHIGGVMLDNAIMRYIIQP